MAGPVSAEGWDGRLGYTVFAGDNLSKLERGEVLGRRATLDRMPNSMAVQTCFLAPSPLNQVAAALLAWDPSKHPELGIRLHREIQSPAVPEDFAALQLSPDLAPDRVILEHSRALSEKSLVQFVSRAELEWFQKFRNDPAAAWRQVLLNRTVRYQTSGLKEMPAFDGVRPPFRLQAGWQNVVSQTPNVTHRFIDLLQVSLNDPKSHAEPGSKKFYWETLTIQGETTFLVGAIYQMPNETSIRTADLQFYVSAHFSSALILYEMWPVMWNGKPSTLVWRGDYVLLPAAVTSQGIERMASENLLLQEVRQAVRAFLKACQ